MAASASSFRRVGLRWFGLSLGMHASPSPFKKILHSKHTENQLIIVSDMHVSAKPVMLASKINGNPLHLTCYRFALIKKGNILTKMYMQPLWRKTLISLIMFNVWSYSKKSNPFMLGTSKLPTDYNHLFLYINLRRYRGHIKAYLPSRFIHASFSITYCSQSSLVWRWASRIIIIIPLHSLLYYLTINYPWRFSQNGHIRVFSAHEGSQSSCCSRCIYHRPFDGQYNDPACCTVWNQHEELPHTGWMNGGVTAPRGF